MASYSVLVKPSVEKDLRALPKGAVARVMRRIEELKNNPIPRQSVKLTGAERLYRIRVGDYRIIYTVEAEAERVVIYYVRHRRQVYRDL